MTNRDTVKLADEAALLAAEPRSKLYKIYVGKSVFLLVQPSGSKWWRVTVRRNTWARRDIFHCIICRRRAIHCPGQTNHAPEPLPNRRDPSRTAGHPLTGHSPCSPLPPSPMPSRMYKLNRLTNSAVTSPGAADFGPCQAGRSGGGITRCRSALLPGWAVAQQRLSLRISWAAIPGGRFRQYLHVLALGGSKYASGILPEGIGFTRPAAGYIFATHLLQSAQIIWRRRAPKWSKLEAVEFCTGAYVSFIVDVLPCKAEQLQKIPLVCRIVSDLEEVFAGDSWP